MSKSTSSAGTEAASHRPVNDAAAIRLLVIEDDSNDQEFLQLQLRRAKIQNSILFINDADQAIETLSREGIEKQIFAVFLDLNLRGVSGLDILRLIRSKDRLRHLPVIIITGSDDPRDREACERLKATSFISKPINFQSFCMAIANVFHVPKLVADPELVAGAGRMMAGCR